MHARPQLPPTVRVRFAPSPTGAMHLGSALVALANAAFVGATDGSFVLRIDDTDVARSSQADADALLRLIEWLGVAWDEGPVVQSARVDAHRAALDRLIQAKRAYPCFCSDERLAQLRAEQKAAGQPPRYDGRCRRLDAELTAASITNGETHVMRLALDAGRAITIQDLVRGPVAVPAGSYGDPVLCRTDGTPGYLLASVVDDVELQITHVIRGEDHLTNTARQIMLFEALDAPVPAFAHLPLLRDDDGRKLSKRHPMGSLDVLVDEGFLPVTVRRYLAELLGHDAVDLLAEQEDREAFAFDRIPTGAPRVDRARLESLGREDMAQLDAEALLAGSSIAPNESLAPLLVELAANSPSLSAVHTELRLVFEGPAAPELHHLITDAAPEAAALDGFDRALALATEHLGGSHAGDDAAWSREAVAGLRRAGKEAGIGVRGILRPVRIALTGRGGGPGLDLILNAIGRAEASRRVSLARRTIEELRVGNEAERG